MLYLRHRTLGFGTGAGYVHGETGVVVMSKHVGVHGTPCRYYFENEMGTSGLTLSILGHRSRGDRTSRGVWWGKTSLGQVERFLSGSWSRRNLGRDRSPSLFERKIS